MALFKRAWVLLWCSASSIIAPGLLPAASVFECILLAPLGGMDGPRPGDVVVPPSNCWCCICCCCWCILWSSPVRWRSESANSRQRTQKPTTAIHLLRTHRTASKEDDVNWTHRLGFSLLAAAAAAADVNPLLVAHPPAETSDDSPCWNARSYRQSLPCGNNDEWRASETKKKNRNTFYRAFSVWISFLQIV